MKSFITFLSLLIIFSCNNNDKKTSPDIVESKIANPTVESKKKFTTACDALSVGDVKKLFDFKIEDAYIPSTEKYANILRCKYEEQSKFVADPFKAKSITIDIQEGENINNWLQTERRALANKKNKELNFFPSAGDSAFYSYYETDLVFHAMATKFSFTLNNQVISVYGHQIDKKDFFEKIKDIYETIKSK